jgi:cytochrome oxidase Cu insertion factor (SCO1/SenC/PrrC family)
MTVSAVALAALLLGACLATVVRAQPPTNAQQITCTKPLTTLYNFTTTDLYGNELAFSKFTGNVLLIVNVATF